MRLTLNYSVFNVISESIHPCDTNTFYPYSHKNPSRETENPLYLNGDFLKLKNFSFRHNKNFNPTVIYALLLLIKLSADLSGSNFLFRFFVKSKDISTLFCK